MLLLEPVDHLLECRVLELEAVPERPLCVAILLLRRRDGLGEAEEGQGEVDKTVLVRLELALAVDDLHSDASVSSIVQVYTVRTLYNSKHTKPVTSDVVVAMAGMILPAICFVVWRSAGWML